MLKELIATITCCKATAVGDGPTESSPGGRLASNVSTWRIDQLIDNSVEGYRKTEHHLSKNVFLKMYLGGSNSEQS